MQDCELQLLFLMKSEIPRKDVYLFSFRNRHLDLHIGRII